MAETKDDLQNQLDYFAQYCKMWKLHVNSSKTKIVIFSRGRDLKNLHFYIDGNELEIVGEFKYLGIYFSKTGSFLRTKKYLVERGTKAMYEIIKKSRLFNLSIECQLDLFDKMIMPILLYGCEIWGFTNTVIIERLHLKYCKLILHLKKSTPNFIVYGELGRFPLSVHIKTRIVNFWAGLIIGKQTKYSYLIYKLIYCKFLNGVNSGWISYLKSIFDECGMSNIWYSQSFSNIDWIVKSIKQKLCDQFIQKWNSDCYNSTKGTSYRLFVRDDFKMQYFLTSNLSVKNKIILSQFRSNNHKLPIESGRWQNIPKQNRTCNLCHKDIGDEFHYLMICDVLSGIRKLYVPLYYRKNPNILKFFELFSSKKTSVLNNLCKFICIINERVNPPG